MAEEDQRREQLGTSQRRHLFHRAGHVFAVPCGHCGKCVRALVGAVPFEIEMEVVDAFEEPDIAKANVPGEVACRTGAGIGLPIALGVGQGGDYLCVVRTSRSKRVTVRSLVAMAKSSL